jgi:hypothetical protein
MKAIIIDDKDCDALLDRLELTMLRKANVLQKETDPVSIDQMHRSFHFVVTRWLQEQGYKGFRS